MATRFLICPPRRDGRPAGSDARRQWDRFVETLLCAGDVTLVEIEPDENGPELMFTANMALICDKLAVLSSLKHPERRRDRSTLRAVLARAGLAATALCQTAFEGAGDALFDRVRPLCYAGYGWGTERSATVAIQGIVGCRALALLLIDKRFSYLDTALCPLGSGHVLAHLAAFAPHAQTLLRRAIEPEYLIEVGVEDALALACNAVEVGDALVLHSASRRLRERLNDAGYRVFGTELDEFVRVGGSAKKLTLRLDDGPVGAVLSRPFGAALRRSGRQAIGVSDAFPGTAQA